MGLVTDEVRARAEKYTGDELCREKTKEFLKEVSMPNGLLPLKDIEEVGYDRQTGIVWLKQKKSITHKFEAISKLVSYATEVTAQVEVGKIKKLSGVKAKELLIWVTLNELVLEEPISSGKINFKTPTGLSRTFPVSAFIVPEVEKPAIEKNNVKEAVAVTDA
ncbi:PREDICTED: uncharacterized protein LOC104787419 isoform X1 [Camelina sativa]|uniref:Uncharacterized protein LOC104701072 n=1 Tax=Camelina sativa TaxID=90675 RepID=A0ABM1R8G1_CAMSA|nr:PREDICTED: uncharacterized protein LOC104701072 [Camelina sativa]XP_010480272.1 PREDICTED: uncharacterized protein LOC104758993 isoform X1 [Camelina sativa]XP_010511300.1 PREDICTED: uncharacterized protein LOC104787419 isoform X2 [Camelina sativa]XP_019095299.1 PREDICTED: uncharacterized protein LOC104758993 isoform X2 [Camelina sativa]XP_019101548.1 PREDICTED: uncharacterized protein LOC104787419 isoform X1 [Camelina sativa]